jgi:XPG I-region
LRTAQGLVEGVITDDSDAFVFGATAVYKNIFEEQKYVEAYLLPDVKRECISTVLRQYRVRRCISDAKVCRAYAATAVHIDLLCRSGAVLQLRKSLLSSVDSCSARPHTASATARMVGLFSKLLSNMVLRR